MEAIVSPTARLYGRIILGKNVLIEDFVVLGHPLGSELSCAMSRQQGETVEFEDLHAGAAGNQVVIGDNSIIRSHSVIYAGVQIGAKFEGGHHILIREGTIVGERVYVKAFSEIMKNVRIGNDCRIAGLLADNAVLEDQVSMFGYITHQYREYYSQEISKAHPERFDFRAAHVSEGAIIGRGATVVGGVRIGRGSIVAAGATVWFDVEDAKVVHTPRPLTRSRTRRYKTT